MNNLFDTEIRYPTSTNVFASQGLLDEGREFTLTMGWKF